jgi:cold shock CspA family protein
MLEKIKLTEQGYPEFNETQRYKGKIIFLSDKGWGFISTPEIAFTRIFFHWTGLNPKVNYKNLNKGANVEFNVKEYEDKGLRAIKIEVIQNHDRP